MKFLYSHPIEFVPRNKVSGIPSSHKFFENLLGITINDQIPIQHSHITGNIIGYSHSYCNWKARENQYKIPVVAHKLFKFDFFFFLRGLRAAVWGTKDIGIGGRNATDINFANTGNQIMFLDTIKYFQQSLGTLANTLTDSEKNAIRSECKEFLQKDAIYSQRFNSLRQSCQKCVLDYLWTTKGTILYEMITRYDSVDLVPENGDFFFTTSISF